MVSLGCLLAQSGTSRAEEVPLSKDTRSLFERAAAPSTSHEIHQRAMELYYLAERGGSRATAKLALEGAERILRYGDARKAKDVRLGFDLGRVLVRLRNCEEAVVVLDEALLKAPTHPFAGSAYFDKAICHALVGQHDLEEAAYLKALALEDEPTTQAIVLANLAEARMSLGKLELAIATAEQSLALEPDAVLPRWTLAIVRDRSGDPSGAVKEALRAFTLDPTNDVLDGPDVFFEPAYERHWYHSLYGLAFAEHAGASSADVDRGLLIAQLAMTAYIEAASTTDRFLPIAKDRARNLEKRLAERARTPAKPTAPKRKAKS